VNIQESLTQIISDAENAKLPYLLVGGHAIILYGITRFTRDFDLLIPETHAEGWKQFLTTKFQYRLFHSTNAFLQFENESSTFPPVDIMMVDIGTWQKLLSKSRNVSLIPKVDARLPHPEHLIAMKLAAHASPTRRWDNEDWSDIIKLIHKQKLSLEDPEFRAIVIKYGSEEILQKLKNALQ
jgi:hypothetical protein